jgi:hypothetical protein
MIRLSWLWHLGSACPAPLFVSPYIQCLHFGGILSISKFCELLWFHVRIQCFFLILIVEFLLDVFSS